MMLSQHGHCWTEIWGKTLTQVSSPPSAHFTRKSRVPFSFLRSFRMTAGSTSSNKLPAPAVSFSVPGKMGDNCPAHAVTEHLFNQAHYLISSSVTPAENSQKVQGRALTVRERTDPKGILPR